MSATRPEWLDGALGNELLGNQYIPSFREWAELAAYFRVLEAAIKELENPPMLYTGPGRWETAIRNIVTLLWGPMAGFDVKSVVEGVTAIKNDRDQLRKLMGHVLKRLNDEYGVELDADWKKRALSEHDLPFPKTDTASLRKQRDELLKALKGVKDCVMVPWDTEAVVNQHIGELIKKVESATGPSVRSEVESQ